jgi:hypothetical protein
MMSDARPSLGVVLSLAQALFLAAPGSAATGPESADLVCKDQGTTIRIDTRSERVWQGDPELADGEAIELRVVKFTRIGSTYGNLSIQAVLEARIPGVGSSRLPMSLQSRVIGRGDGPKAILLRVSGRNPETGKFEPLTDQPLRCRQKTLR